MAQPVNDSTDQKDISQIIDYYYRSLGEESPLFNGSEYLEYAFTLQDGHPFFESPSWVNGDIDFDGMRFHDVPMLYDIIKDQVIIRDFQKVHKINLRADKIQQFELAGHTFVRIRHDSSDQIKTGFYDELYMGEIGLFAKREKKIIEKSSSLEIGKIVISQNVYFIKKDGIFYNIKNRSTLFNVLKNKKKEIQQYLKKKNVKYKRDPERTIMLAVEYYDQLKD